MGTITKVQFNPSTQKVLFNPDTQKVMTTCTYACDSGKTVRLTFSGVNECAAPNDTWPSDLNGVWDIPWSSESGTTCLWYYNSATWNISFAVRKATCLVRILTNYPSGGDVHSPFVSSDWVVGVGAGSLNNIYVIGDCGNADPPTDVITGYDGTVSWVFV